jgi:hypothetical protein
MGNKEKGKMNVNVEITKYGRRIRKKWLSVENSKGKMGVMRQWEK